MERKIKLYGGVPSRQAMCRVVQESVVNFVQQLAKHSQTKRYAKSGVAALMADDKLECVSASSEGFKSMVGIPAADLAVLLKFQEELIFQCAKWK